MMDSVFQNKIKEDKKVYFIYVLFDKKHINMLSQLFVYI